MKSKRRKIKNTKMGVPKDHFWVYFGCMIISLLLCVAGILINVYLNCELTTTILISLGTGGVTSSLVGYFVELANGKQNTHTKQMLLRNIAYTHKLTLVTFLNRLVFLMLNIYKYKDKKLDQPYTINLEKDKQKIVDILTAFDNDFLSCGNGAVVVDFDKGMCRTNALKSLELLNQKVTMFNKSMDELLSNSSVDLLKYFNEYEISCLTSIASASSIEDLNTLEDYASLYETLLDEQFCKIIDVKPSKLVYYCDNFKKAIYNKDKLWKGSELDINNKKFNNLFD